MLILTWWKRGMKGDIFFSDRTFKESEKVTSRNQIIWKQHEAFLSCKSTLCATHSLSVHEAPDSSCNFTGKQDDQAAEELQDRTKNKTRPQKNKKKVCYLFKVKHARHLNLLTLICFLINTRNKSKPVIFLDTQAGMQSDESCGEKPLFFFLVI